jgi:hypothetical protein
VSALKGFRLRTYSSVFLFELPGRHFRMLRVGQLSVPSPCRKQSMLINSTSFIRINGGERAC